MDIYDTTNVQLYMSILHPQSLARDFSQNRQQARGFIPRANHPGKNPQKSARYVSVLLSIYILIYKYIVSHNYRATRNALCATNIELTFQNVYIYIYQYIL